MLRSIRITVQTVFFLLFTVVFFFVNSLPAAYTAPADSFLRLNPLVALLTSVATRGMVGTVFFTGLAVAVATVVFGRFFCGFICPLGATIDFSDRFILNKVRSGGRRPPRYLQRLKYLLLFMLLVLALYGVLFPLFMDPISLLTRIFAIVINPLVKLTGLELLSAGRPILDAIGLGSLKFITLKTPQFYGTAFVVLLFAAVIAGGFWDKRFWCQYVCPSGALFGLLSRFPLFRRMHVASGCNSCGACSRVCPTRAIDATGIARTNTAECIECGLCTRIKDGCSGFRFARPSPADIKPPDIRRRHLLLGAAGGVLLVPAFRATAINTADGHGRLIRPPGSVPEKEFLSRCIACGNCMKACPTNTLQPCTISDGFNRLYTPKMVPRIGACDSKCHLCGYACPTGAIRRLSSEDKPYARVGTAVIDRHRCLAWVQRKECLVCDESCPFNAIEPRLVETLRGPFKVPVVREDLCTGCGMCELQCPVFDKGAIEVFRFGENRRSRGPYVTEAQKEKLEKMRKESDRDLIAGISSGEKSSAPVQDDRSNEERKTATAPQHGDLPPGFTE
ncbi:MAG: 4Fe-4S binding protein [Chitinispirillaceae bacterium]|nr:4Fe-4S binding protein [Chitinispirillaceae bacterium]